MLAKVDRNIEAEGRKRTSDLKTEISEISCCKRSLKTYTNDYNPHSLKKATTTKLI